MGRKAYKNKSAKDLFPALFEESNYEKNTESKTSHYRRKKQFNLTPKIPRPPDKKWLKTRNFTDKYKKENKIKRALILSKNKELISIYNNVFAKFNFKIDLANSEPVAIELISSILFSLVAYENSLDYLNFEQYMRNLAGDKRRNLYYIIIGSELRTLYDLEALCLSANLVVNNKDVKHLDKILKKGLLDYETLYRPFIEILETNKGSWYQ